MGTKRRGNGRLKAVLEEPGVRAWYDARRLRSPISADLEGRKLHFVSEQLKITPVDIVRLAKKRPEKLRDLFVALAARMKAKGRQDSYISKVFGAVAGWIRFNGVEFHLFPKLSPIAGETLKAERVPTPDELRSILAALPLRGRVTALLVAHAGIRPGVLGSYTGTSGLTLGDLPELILDGEGAPRFNLAPGRKSIRINVPASLSKTRRAYVTFGTLELAEAILAYLKDRTHQDPRYADHLSPASPLVALSPLGGRNRAKTDPSRSKWVPMTTKSVILEVREAISKVKPEGVRWRPYVLRSYCSTQLWTARVDRDAREAMLGHNLGTSGRYNLSKKLGDGLVDEMRSEYEKAVPYLESFARPETGPKTRELARKLLRMFGPYIPAEEIDKLDLDAATPEELQAFAQRYFEEHARPLTFRAVPAKVTQRIVPLEKADEMLAQGAEVVEALGPNRDKLLLRIPAEARA